MRVLSVDLASKSYDRNGLVVLEQARDVVRARVLKPRDLGLTDPPAVEPFAEALVACCDREGIQTVLIDGPQGWKHPSNGLEHCRVCERVLNTMGKAGLPGRTKPANFLVYIAFSVALFEELTRRGFGLLGGESTARLALEIYPAAAAKKLGIKPGVDVDQAVGELRRLFGVQVADGLAHDELQALVAAFAGFAVQRGHTAGYVAAGIAPTRVDGTWREGFIVNPTRDALGGAADCVADTQPRGHTDNASRATRTIIGVMGPGAGAGVDDCACAEELGGLVARAGWVLLTGGRDAGVMAAACRGAKRAGGLTLGILPGETDAGASPDVDLAIVTGLGQGRDNLNVLTSRVVIACGMGAGTAAEVALALKAGRPVVLLRASDAAWSLFRELGGNKVQRATNAHEATDIVRRLLGAG